MSSMRDKNSFSLWELGCLFCLSLSSSLPTPNFQRRKLFQPCYSITLGIELKHNSFRYVIYLLIQMQSTNKIQLILMREHFLLRHSMQKEVPRLHGPQGASGERTPACKQCQMLSSFIFTTSRGCEISCVGNHRSLACAIPSFPVNSFSPVNHENTKFTNYNMTNI